MKTRIIAVISLLAAAITPAKAVSWFSTDEQSPGLIWAMLHGLEYEVNAGINIGGSSPMPIPGEIRSILHYDPGLNLSFGGSVTKWVDKNRRWGVSLGIRFENKGMDTEAKVKNYGMAIIQDGAEVAGRWTGKVITNYSSSFFTVPLTGVYRLSNRCKISFGPYIAIAMKRKFWGKVHDGYLRETDPTGDKIVFAGDAEATYDFSEHLRRMQWGLEAGFSWRAYRHLMVQTHLSWGMNGIFHSSFKTVNFSLYPIYLNVGFGYGF